MSSLLLSFTLSFVSFAGDRTVEVTIEGGQFHPAIIELRASDNTTLIVTNKGSDAEEFESIELNKEKIILPGKTAKIKLGKLRPGVYKFFGEFHPTTAQGKILVSP